MVAEPQKMIYLKDYTPSAFLIDSVALYFELHEAHTEVTAVMTCRRNPQLGASSAPLILDGQGLALQSCALDGVTLSDSAYAVSETNLTIHVVPDSFELTTVVQIDPGANKAFMGLYRSRGNYCTQCEAEGFRHITYFLDRPDIMTRFTTTIIADGARYPYLLSNGNCIETTTLADGRTRVVWEDPSLKPCYLFALVAGDFDVLRDTFVTMSGREVELVFYLEKGFGEQGHYALASLKRAMRWDEERYGLEYDLSIYMVVAVSDFNMGAMENKGLNVFNTKYVLAQPETATDADYVAIEDVIGHEYFHNWTGNRVTCRDWFQLTLKEGLTVFRDQTFSEDMTSAAVSRIAEVSVVRRGQFPEDAGPLAHPIRPASYMEINNFYTATVYRKGAEVIRMIRTLISPASFRQGMDLYFARHDGSAVTTDDFVTAMADASGRDLTQFLRWYDQAGTPVVAVESQYDEAKQCLELTFTQSCPPTPECQNKAPFHMPFRIGLLSTSGKPMAMTLAGQAGLADGDSLVVELTERQTVLTLTGVLSAPVISLNRGFSAPVKVEYGYSLTELAVLAQHDTDAVARWDAATQLYSRAIIASATAANDDVEPIVIATMARLLEDETTDLNLMAQLVQLPVVNDLLQLCQDVDVTALHQARARYQHTIATALEAQWLHAYSRYHRGETYTYSVEKMGERAWKNACLGYLVASGQDGHAQLAFSQLREADNMTDSMGALSALNQHVNDCRQEALALFYSRWQNEPLVVNKWLSMQASATLGTTLADVKQLMSHDAFDIKNPNNVYALLCAFGANGAALHTAAEGEGYTLLADQVIEINQFNPQVAARVLMPLTRWQQIDTTRGQLMRAQLKRIAAQPALSSDVSEMVQKSLV